MADEVEEAEAAIPGLRSQTAVHEGQIAWIESEYGIDVSTYSAAEVLAVGYATRVAWRQTEAYQEAKASLSEAREAAAEEKRIAREEAAAERAAAKEAKEAEKAAKASEGEAKPVKGSTKKAAPAKAAAKKAPAKGKGKAKDPFA